MKTVKATCAAILLALSLSIPASADGGDQQTPGKNIPVPVGAPSPTVPGANLSSGISAESDEINFSMFADIVWALASIY